MTRSNHSYLSAQAPFVPFRVDYLPLIARLRLIGFHKYKNRWAKRFGKKLGRLLFDFAYDVLRFSGQGMVEVTFGTDKKMFQFDARNLHYLRIYDHQMDTLCEPELAAVLNAFLTGDRVFYDIGSNWGYFALYAATLPGYEGEIHAFEPIRETFDELQDWVAQLGQERRVHCHNLAISDADGPVQMGIVSGDSGLASILRTDGPSSRHQIAEARRLDTLDLPAPDFIKLDVEGFEHEAICGALKTLASHQPMIMFENWISRDKPEQTLSPIEVLEKLGYQLFVPMWWIGEPSNQMYWPISHHLFPKGVRTMAFVPFNIEFRFSMRDQINFFCCHNDRMEEFEQLFTRREGPVEQV